MCIHAFNNLHYPILVQGIIGARGTFLGTNPSYTPYELNHALNVSKTTIIIAEPDLLPALKQPAAELGISNANIFVFVAPNGIGMPEHYTWRSLVEHREEDWLHFDDLEIAKNTTAFLMFSHYNLIAQHILVHEKPQHPEAYPVSRITCLPFFHAATAPYTHTTTLSSGKPSYIMRRFQLADFLKYTERYHVTSTMLVPSMVVAIVNLAKEKPEFIRSCLRSIVSGVAGAAPLDPEMQRALQELLPKDAVFTQLWTMTETSCVASYFYHPEANTTGSVGRFMPNLDVKLVDDEDREIHSPYDKRGELCMRGLTVIRGYLDNPEANGRDWDADGFFHTGDILYCDSKTKLWYVVDREKELIRVRGFQVAPNELEGVLLSHPAIQDAAVIGVEADEAGEVPRAYVVRREGKEVSEAEVKEWLESRLAKYKRLEGGVKFVESIPKTASGKILKTVLREESRRGMGARL